MKRKTTNGSSEVMTVGDLADLVRAHKSREAAVALVDAYCARNTAEAVLAIMRQVYADPNQVMAQVVVKRQVGARVHGEGEPEKSA